MRSILLLEDDPAIRHMIKTALEQDGFFVIEVGNGIDGLTKVQEHSFDCVVTDLKMPQMDGLTFIKELRKLPHQANKPVIVFSSITQDYIIPEVLKAGATKLLLKDEATPSQLIDTINSLVEDSQQPN